MEGTLQDTLKAQSSLLPMTSHYIIHNDSACDPCPPKWILGGCKNAGHAIVHRNHFDLTTRHAIVNTLLPLSVGMQIVSKNVPLFIELYMYKNVLLFDGRVRWSHNMYFMYMPFSFCICFAEISIVLLD